MKYAIISDIHGNLEALEAVLNKCNEEGVERYICLGDIVGYNTNPSECLEIIRSLELVGCVKGNHDEYASNNDEEMIGFNPHAKKAVLWTVEQLTEEQRYWLASRPMRQNIKGLNITIVHATLDSPDAWGYIFDNHHAADNFSYQFTQLCFCGHSHVPLAFCKLPVTARSDNPIMELPEWVAAPGDLIDFEVPTTYRLALKPGLKYLVNVGSIGQPRNKDPRASFAIYDDVEKVLYRHCLPYDIETTRTKILAAGLPERLAKRLLLGS